MVLHSAPFFWIKNVDGIRKKLLINCFVISERGEKGHFTGKEEGICYGNFDSSMERGGAVRIFFIKWRNILPFRLFFIKHYF